MAFIDRYQNILAKVHITRILGTNKAGDIISDIWADVERVEGLAVATQLTGQYQKVNLKFRWRDDPDDQTYRAEDDMSENENLTSNATVVVKVCSPDEADLNDPEEWIPIRVNTRIRMLEGGEGGMTSKQFLSDQLTKDLGVRLRRIYHHDTSMDDRAEAAFDANPARKAYVERAHLYAKDDETKDESQYIECEIVTNILKYENAHEKSTGTDQKAYVKLKNQYLIDESEPAELEELGTNDKNPPYRLDPFQNIINVQWSTGEEAVMFVAGGTIISSNKGTAWDDFKTDSMTAASGLGKTVIGSGSKLVVFGKPRDGAACFMAATLGGTEVKRGVLDDEGELTWSTVHTVARGIYACSFAGGAFFISHGDVADETLITSSFDGETFGASVNPFPGANSPANANPDGEASDPAGGPEGGSVAYDTENERWVATGSFSRWYTAEFILHTGGGDETFRTVQRDANFMSAVSTDGATWTGQYYDTSESWGTNNSISGTAIASASDTATTVCFGKGVFVAASGFKTQHLSPNTGGFSQTFIYGNTACGVATSSNGVSWNNLRLPGTQASVDEDGVNGGTTACVGFFKTGGVDANGYKNGFFLAAGFEFEAGVPITRTAKLWRSDDGLSWTEAKTEANKTYRVLSPVKKNADPDKATII